MKWSLAESVTADEREALKQFASLGISVANFLSRMTRLIHVGTFRVGDREITVQQMPGVNLPVTRDDVRWVFQRYLHGKTSGEELSHWAGLLLAITAYDLPHEPVDDDVLELLNDVALPLKDEYLDRENLKARIARI